MSTQATEAPVSVGVIRRPSAVRPATRIALIVDNSDGWACDSNRSAKVVGSRSDAPGSSNGANGARVAVLAS